MRWTGHGGKDFVQGAGVWTDPPFASILRGAGVLPSHPRSPMDLDSTIPDDGASTGARPLTASTLSASLTVSDLARSIAWYRDVVGFTIDREHERGGRVIAVSLRAGDVRILIGQDDGAKGMDRVKGDGFSLMIATSQPIDEIATGIKARGGTLASEPMDTPWGGRVVRLQDPDGFRLAISSER